MLLRCGAVSQGDSRVPGDRAWWSRREPRPPGSFTFTLGRDRLSDVDDESPVEAKSIVDGIDVALAKATTVTGSKPPAQSLVKVHDVEVGTESEHLPRQLEGHG